jgi:hypothetical protein
MILPASKEEGKLIKKRYAVFNFDGRWAHAADGEAWGLRGAGWGGGRGGRGRRALPPTVAACERASHARTHTLSHAHACDTC